jgi:hypothetical protein
MVGVPLLTQAISASDTQRKGKWQNALNSKKTLCLRASVVPAFITLPNIEKDNSKPLARNQTSFYLDHGTYILRSGRTLFHAWANRIGGNSPSLPNEQINIFGHHSRNRPMKIVTQASISMIRPGGYRQFFISFIKDFGGT